MCFFCFYLPGDSLGSCQVSRFVSMAAQGSKVRSEGIGKRGETGTFSSTCWRSKFVYVEKEGSLYDVFYLQHSWLFLNLTPLVNTFKSLFLAWLYSCCKTCLSIDTQSTSTNTVRTKALQPQPIHAYGYWPPITNHNHYIFRLSWMTFAEHKSVFH